MLSTDSRYPRWHLDVSLQAIVDCTTHHTRTEPLLRRLVCWAGRILHLFTTPSSQCNAPSSREPPKYRTIRLQLSARYQIFNHSFFKGLRSAPVAYLMASNQLKEASADAMRVHATEVLITLQAIACIYTACFQIQVSASNSFGHRHYSVGMNLPCFPSELTPNLKHTTFTRIRKPSGTPLTLVEKESYEVEKREQTIDQHGSRPVDPIDVQDVVNLPYRTLTADAPMGEFLTETDNGF